MLGELVAEMPELLLEGGIPGMPLVLTLVHETS
jgi:hypothetical protein